MHLESDARQEIPIINDGRPFYVDTYDLRQIGRGNVAVGDTFLRHIYTSGPREQTLEDRIATADTELSNLAQFCGASVVKHTFGWRPFDVEEHEEFRMYRMPEGHFLVAEVETLEVKRFRPRPLRLYTGIIKYLMNGGQLRDLSPRQFVYARPKTEPDASFEWTLVDIEPRINNPSMRHNVSS